MKELEAIILAFPERLGRLESVAYCPVPSYEERHAYLTSAPNRAGGTWVCEECHKEGFDGKE